MNNEAHAVIELKVSAIDGPTARYKMNRILEALNVLIGDEIEQAVTGNTLEAAYASLGYVEKEKSA